MTILSSSNSIFDHPVILFIIVIVTMLRWLLQRPKTPADDPERPKVPDEPIPRQRETESEEERIRRFLEALGQPTRSTPPPKVTRRVVVTKREGSSPVPPFKSPLPPLTTSPQPSVRKPPPVPTFSAGPAQVFPPPPSPPIKQPFTKSKASQETSYEVRDVSAPAPGDPSLPYQRLPESQQSFILKLASTQDLRRAIILREILGPPRGLQLIREETI